MGCCSGRSRLQVSQPYQEKAICYQESLLGYSKWPFAHALEVLKRCSDLGKLTANQFTSFVTELELNRTDVDTLDSQLFTFYSRFKDKKGRFSAFKLTVLLALLCHGAVLDKAQGLFEQFPDLQAGVMSTEGLEKLLTVVFDIAVEAIPQLALADLSIPAETLSLADLTAYLSPLRAARPALQQRCVATLTSLSPSLVLQDFVARATEVKDEVKLCSALEVRLQLGQTH